ncbi:D-alanine--D-alanine ligase (plasmid) [Rossellomorea sp. AcN35-11]|nr:D-alanine--D-alanine ligase [Rossellomorea aquimaris]WJV31875.1 D-alanine--D-alanine ligase [Rossellomorea sp. AcN35-11]
MKTNMCLLYGGKSAEHHVSLRTALSVINHLDTSKFTVTPVYITEEGRWVKGELNEAPIKNVEKLQFNSTEETTAVDILTKTEIDIVFPLLHGPNGEDGTIQGLLEVLNIPYVGNGVLASAAGMDKIVMKSIFKDAGLEQVEYTWFTRRSFKENPENPCDSVEKTIGFPCFVKPANLGSSVGINKCNDKTELLEAFKEAFQYDRRVIVEEGVVAREIEVGVIGNEEPLCSVVGEIVPKKDFYDYKAKYENGDTELMIPTTISEDLYQIVERQAIEAYKSLDCSGLVRADFFLTAEGKLLINEVNTMPGFTPVSMFPLLWKETGLDYPSLIEKLVELGLERYKDKQETKYSF